MTGSFARETWLGCLILRDVIEIRTDHYLMQHQRFRKAPMRTKSVSSSRVDVAGSGGVYVFDEAVNDNYSLLFPPGSVEGLSRQPGINSRVVGEGGPGELA